MCVQQPARWQLAPVRPAAGIWQCPSVGSGVGHSGTTWAVWHLNTSVPLHMPPPAGARVCQRLWMVSISLFCTASGQLLLAAAALLAGADAGHSLPAMWRMHSHATQLRSIKGVQAMCVCVLSAVLCAVSLLLLRNSCPVSTALPLCCPQRSMNPPSSSSTTVSVSDAFAAPK